MSLAGRRRLALGKDTRGSTRAPRVAEPVRRRASAWLLAGRLRRNQYARGEALVLAVRYDQGSKQ